MEIYGARAHIITALQTLLDGVVLDKEVQEHRGQFASLEEIQSIAARSPAVRVAFRGVQRAQRQGPELLVDVLWVVHVFATDSRGQKRNTLAGGIAITTLDHIADEAARWDFAEDEPQGLTALDMSTLPLDKAGISLWQITWSQRCRLQIIDPMGALTDFDGFDTDHFAPGANTETEEPLAKTSANYPE